MFVLVPTIWFSCGADIDVMILCLSLYACLAPVGAWLSDLRLLCLLILRALDGIVAVAVPVVSRHFLVWFVALSLPRLSCILPLDMVAVQ